MNEPNNAVFVGWMVTNHGGGDVYMFGAAEKLKAERHYNELVENGWLDVAMYPLHRPTKAHKSNRVD